MNELQEQQATYKTGVVSETDPNAVTARVRFEDLDGLETAMIPVGQRKTLEDKDYWMPDVGEHVACLMDANLEDGVILCAIYSRGVVPPITDPDKRHIRFKDGTSIEYDRRAHRLSIECVGDVEVIAQGDVTVQASGNADVQAGADARVSASGNAEMRANGFGQVVADGPLLIKSNSRLTLKGRRSQMDL
mgnify:FL=1